MQCNLKQVSSVSHPSSHFLLYCMYECREAVAFPKRSSNKTRHTTRQCTTYRFTNRSSVLVLEITSSLDTKNGLHYGLVLGITSSLDTKSGVHSSTLALEITSSSDTNRSSRARCTLALASVFADTSRNETSGRRKRKPRVRVEQRRGRRKKKSHVCPSRSKVVVIVLSDLPMVHVPAA